MKFTSNYRQFGQLSELSIIFKRYSPAGVLFVKSRRPGGLFQLPERKAQNGIFDVSLFTEPAGMRYNKIV